MPTMQDLRSSPIGSDNIDSQCSDDSVTYITRGL